MPQAFSSHIAKQPPKPRRRRVRYESGTVRSAVRSSLPETGDGAQGGGPVVLGDLIPDCPDAFGRAGVAHYQVRRLAAQRFGKRFEQVLVIAALALLQVGDVADGGSNHLGKLLLRVAAVFPPRPEKPA